MPQADTPPVIRPYAAPLQDQDERLIDCDLPRQETGTYRKDEANRGASLVQSRPHQHDDDGDE